MSNANMPDDLRWLAENVEQWKVPHFRWIMKDESGFERYCNDLAVNAERLVDGRPVFSKYQWQDARQQIEDERMDHIGQNGNDGLHYGSVMTPEEQEMPAETFRGKYHREIKPGVWVDVYDVLTAWAVENPALQHLIKKALAPGQRGHKTLEQDMNDIIVSAKRAKELSE